MMVFDAQSALSEFQDGSFYLNTSFEQALFHKHGYLVYAITHGGYHSFDIIKATSAVVSRPTSSHARLCLSREARTKHLSPTEGDTS
jgi:hypothetical protein